MTETQQYLLEMFKEMDYICKKYGIDYYLGGGSLVGAIRHGGFLPWDDDADVHMSIENATKFKEAVEKEGLKDRVVYIKSDNGDYMNTHWRYENTASTLLMRGLTGSKGAQGQFIDIFLTYPLPLNEKKAQQCLDDFELYCELRAQNTTIGSKRSPEYLKRYFRYKKLEKVMGKKWVIDYLEKKMYHFSQEEAKDWFICAPFPEKRLVPKAWWGKPRYVKYEDMELPVAEYAEKILSYSYGPAWFELPTYSERGEHTFVKDFEIPYSVYTAEYNKYLDIREFYNQEVEKKEYWFGMMEKRNKLHPIARRLEGLKVVMEIQDFVERAGIDLRQLVEEKRFEEIAAVFSNYFALITTQPFKYWGLYIDLPDDYLYAAAYKYCYDGNYGMAKKLLNGRRNNASSPLPPEIERLCELCDATDKLLLALYSDLDYEAAAGLVKEYRAKEPDALYFMRAEIYLALRGVIEMSDHEILDRCDQYLAVYPKDGELMKYKGDLIAREGRSEEADHYYKLAYNNVKNGFCCIWIKRHFEEKGYEDYA